MADLPILEELGAALETAFALEEERAARPATVVALAPRASAPAQRPRRTLVLAAMLLLLLTATAAAGTVVVLRATVIPAPDPEVAGLAQTPAPGTSRLADARAADPARATTWALRVARSRTGLVCGTVGELRGADFGLTGLDGRFRLVPERLVDGCSAPRRDAPTLLGVRVFDAVGRADVRTVAYGLVTGVAAVEVVARGRSHRVRVLDDGSFAAAFAGLPEDLGLRVTLVRADGRREAHPFGTSPFVVPDPAGGAAWRAESMRLGRAPGEPGDPRTCVAFGTARPVRSRTVSPSACGVLTGVRTPRGLFFAVRRIVPGTGGGPFTFGGEGNWGEHPARTAVWGAAGHDVERVEVLWPGGRRALATIAPSRAVLAVLPGDVDPDVVRVRVTDRSGRVRTYSGSTGLRKER